MKKERAVVILAMSAVLALAACAYKTRPADDETAAVENEVSAPSSCVGGCICYEDAMPETVDGQIPDTENISAAQTQISEEESPKENTDESTDKNAAAAQETDSESDNYVRVSELSEGEIEARRQQQANFAAARATLYSMQDSIDKTVRMNQMDRQILANNAYDFGGKTIVFIGDSITEGITSAIDQHGNYISYVTYANSYLRFARVINQGKGGRMFTTYGGDELSLSSNFGNVTNVDADIIVVFAGVNDYLGVAANKRFGSVDDKLTTGNYCGSVRYFMSQLQMYYSDREIFFVTMYDINKKSNSAYVDYEGQPTLGDFMDAQKELAKEFGFKVIDLYGTGFMDCSTKMASDYFLRDGLHPKDSGSIFLGEHIAAEISLYFSQKGN